MRVELWKLVFLERRRQQQQGSKSTKAATTNRCNKILVYDFSASQSHWLVPSPPPCCIISSNLKTVHPQ
ncbi:hypothetical protein K1719_006147 [Acacia pycnantha]|nr:hypothetical protein K1719_006147 [Acacia pycnantha]